MDLRDELKELQTMIRFDDRVESLLPFFSFINYLGPDSHLLISDSFQNFAVRKEDNGKPECSTSRLLAFSSGTAPSAVPLSGLPYTYIYEARSMPFLFF
jgi:hypothetical protein